MSILEIASLVSAGALGATRLLTVAKPFWEKLPKGFAALVPAACIMLPQLASQMGLVHTTMDFVSACLFCGALMLPGLASKHA